MCDMATDLLSVNDRRILAGLLEKVGAASLAVPVLRALDKRQKQGDEAVIAEMTAAGLAAEHAVALLETTQRGTDEADTLASLADDVRGSAGVEVSIASEAWRVRIHGAFDDFGFDLDLFSLMSALASGSSGGSDRRRPLLVVLLGCCHVD